MGTKVLHRIYPEIIISTKLMKLGPISQNDTFSKQRERDTLHSVNEWMYPFVS